MSFTYSYFRFGLAPKIRRLPISEIEKFSGMFTYLPTVFTIYKSLKIKLIDLLELISRARSVSTGTSKRVFGSKHYYFFKDCTLYVGQLVVDNLMVDSFMLNGCK